MPVGLDAQPGHAGDATVGVEAELTLVVQVFDRVSHGALGLVQVVGELGG